MTVKPLALSIV